MTNRVLLLAACSVDSSDLDSSGSFPANTCIEQVRVSFYDEASCTPGTEVSELTFDLSQSC